MSILSDSDIPSFYTCNSVSGGKTSGYMYLEHPTDVSLFAMVKSSHPANAIKDPGILAEVQRRCPGATGSMELEVTLRAVLDLEQLGGRAITWVASEWTFEQLVMKQTDLPGFRGKGAALPDRSKRFCTQWLKLYPIWEHCYFHRDGIPLMNIGFRRDEPQRVEEQDRCDQLNHIEAPLSCTVEGLWQWQRVYWREVQFPLYQAGITRLDVLRRMATTGIEFPAVSNCAYCPFHLVSEHRQQYRENPEQLEAWVDLERQVSAHYGKPVTFHKKHSVADAAKGKAVKDWGPMFACACTD